MEKKVKDVKDGMSNKEWIVNKDKDLFLFGHENFAITTISCYCFSKEDVSKVFLVRGAY